VIEEEVQLGAREGIIASIRGVEPASEKLFASAHRFRCLVTVDFPAPGIPVTSRQSDTLTLRMTGIVSACLQRGQSYLAG
jgi:hypothetical protein